MYSVDMLTLVGHKFGATKGVAALYIRRGVQLPPFLSGGGQESSMRAGTESTVLIAALGKAAQVS
jgi:cysteine desulfurase